MNGRFENTRRVLEGIAAKRNNTFKRRKRPIEKRNQTRSRPRTKANQPIRFSKVSKNDEKLVNRPSRQHTVKTTTRGPGFAIVSTDENRFKNVFPKQLHALCRKVFNNNNSLQNNFLDKNSFSEIKPPVLTQGIDQFGPHVVIAGSESLTTLKVSPAIDASTDHTVAGDSLLYRFIAPPFLPETRFRLISEQYSRWKPVDIQVRFIPMVSATQTGAITMVPLTDPDATLSIGDDPDEKIARAMDYENAITFNIYNYATVHFPKLPDDEEPYYLLPDGNARFEIPYALAVLANSMYVNDLNPLESDITIGWLKIDYKVKMYHPVLPDMLQNYTLSEQSLQGRLISDLFEEEYVQERYPALANYQLIQPDPAGGLDTQNIYVLTVEEDVLWDNGLNGAPLRFYDAHNNNFNLSKGLILIGRYVFNDGFNAASTGLYLKLYTSIDDAYNGDNGLFWSIDFVPVVAALILKGKIKVECFEINHEL